MAIPKTKSRKTARPVADEPKTALARWLKKNKRSQVWLADALAPISTAQVNRLVAGRNMPRAKLAERIKQLTGITLDQLAKDAGGHDDVAKRIERGQRLIARGEAMIKAAQAAAQPSRSASF